MGSGRKTDREKELEGVNLLGLAPRRIAHWEESEGRIVLTRPEPLTSGFRGLMDRFFHKMSANRIKLDDVGGFAWRGFDGVRTVGQVVEMMRQEFGDKVEPAEERLGHFVWIMRKEGFLSYPGWDDEA